MRVVPLVELEGEIVSSSHIRGLVLAGDLRTPGASSARRSRCAARSSAATGAAARSATRPRTSSPTTATRPRATASTPAWRRGTPRARHPAAVNVGVRPTFNTGRGVLVEAYVIDVEADLYGKDLRLDFLERLRGERRFDSVDALVDQMALDVERARSVAGA